ncbi:50S ribosomal protein L22 [Candidatus Persebacteraceae bacterium Df01]|jgi:large subunit ribosomal protein L22|uniref:Large ribosomal subunit protein uL22 n=1 Tax=Candidatus Doriopsillibacter californiensis TaxID=2970740 RepID=A0ABT7QKS4_9GAMM|nr:50S ribosomal protein L22 [Candidatus Persebacteraceae bacterium Df01]
MQTARAIIRNAPLSPQKGRLVADQVRGMNVGKAMECLLFSRKKAAAILRKGLSSAIANAEENAGADIDALYVARIEVTDGMTIKRIRFGARGRVSRINKRRSHVLIQLAAKEGK